MDKITVDFHPHILYPYGMRKTILGRGVAGKLSMKDRLFIAHVLRTDNLTESYKLAGFKSKYPASCAAKLVKKPAVAKELARLRELKANELNIDVNYVLKGFKTVAERCMQATPKLKRIGKGDDGEAVHIQATDAEGNLLFEFDSAGANRALEMLGRHLGMFKNEVDLNMKTYQHFRDQKEKYGFTEDAPQLPQKET
jgi:phage terminase small subunit